MKNTILIFLLAFVSFCGSTQGVKANLYDKFLKKQRVETEALFLTGLTGKNKLAIGFVALGSTLYLTMNGTGWGTTTIDNGDELILLFSNDSVVTLKSTALQSFEPGMLQNTFHHQYAISTSQLEALGESDLVSIRKYSFNDYSDLKVPQENTAKLKKLSALFVDELKKANLFKTLRQISSKDIRDYIGDSVAFCSRIYKTRYYEESADGPTLLDVQANFSDPVINVVILQNDREKFNGAPERKFQDKEVCISGVVTLQNGVPQIVIRDREQIKLKSPVNLNEIELFAGDSVSVTGKVFTARYLEDTKTKPTLLNIGAPFPDQPLTLVIEGEDRVNFSKPEEEYLYKTLRVTGKVVLYKDKPQIVLSHPRQIEVLSGPDPDSTLIAKQPKEVVTDTAAITSAKPAFEEVKPDLPEMVSAEFPGGGQEFSIFLRENLQNPEPLTIDEQKKVIVSFEIDVNGNCQNIAVLESAGFIYDNEAKRVLQKMPKWRPAMKNGLSVVSQIIQPILFKGR